MKSPAISYLSNNASKDIPVLSKSSFRAVIVIVLIVSLGFAIPGRVLAQTFNDVSEDHWAYSF